MEGASYSRIYGGGWSDGSKAADVQGNVSITVKGNTNANTIYGGGYAIAKNGNASANVSGTVTVNVPAVPKSNHEFFYGGGSAQVTGKYDAAANVGQVRLHAIGRIREVNGGGSATVDKTAAETQKLSEIIGFSSAREGRYKRSLQRRICQRS